MIRKATCAGASLLPGTSSNSNGRLGKLHLLSIVVPQIVQGAKGAGVLGKEGWSYPPSMALPIR